MTRRMWSDSNIRIQLVPLRMLELWGHSQIRAATLHNGRDLVQSLLVFAACDVAAIGLIDG